MEKERFCLEIFHHFSLFFINKSNLLLFRGLQEDKTHTIVNGILCFKLHHIFPLNQEKTRILSKFIKIGYEKPSRLYFFLLLLFILCTQSRNLWNCITCLSPAYESPVQNFSFHDDAAWWKKINFLLPWFFVFACLPCYHFLFILLLLSLKEDEVKHFLPFSLSRLRMGLMIGIEFRLSIFRYENLCGR